MFDERDQHLQLPASKNVGGPPLRIVEVAANGVDAGCKNGEVAHRITRGAPGF
jgi:hypothetical protein